MTEAIIVSVGPPIQREINVEAPAISGAVHTNKPLSE